MAGKFKLQYKGLKYGGSSIRQSLNNYLDELKGISEDESKKVAEEIVEEAKERVNIHTGRLLDSGKIISIPSIKKGFKWAIRFSAYNPRDGYNYAYVQHEDPYGDGKGSRFVSGWHYLQIPFEEHMREFTKRLAETMRRV